MTKAIFKGSYCIMPVDEKYQNPNMPTLTEEEINRKAMDILSFLKQISPLAQKMTLPNDDIFLSLESAVSDFSKLDYYKRNERLEIRALKRDGQNPFYANFIINSFDSYVQGNLSSFLSILYNNKIPFDLYYSLYTFNKDELIENKNGPVKIKKVCKDNVIRTSTVSCDFDDITETEFLLEYNRFIDMDIEPTITVFSGHGYQCHWKIETTYDITFLKLFCQSLLNAGFHVDKKICDCSRILRLPFTHNCKDFSKTENASAIETYIYRKTNKQYDFALLYDKLLSNTIYEEVSFEPKKKAKNKKEIIHTIDKSFLKYNYKDFLNIDILPAPVQIMLMGFQEGHANDVLLFLVSYLKEVGLSLPQILEITSILSTLNTYNWAWDISEVSRNTKRFYYAAYHAKAVYERFLLKDFGPMEFVETNGCIKIDNEIIYNISHIGTRAFKTYIEFLCFNIPFEGTMSGFSKFFGISEKNLRTRFLKLQRNGLIYRKAHTNKKNQEVYCYFLNVLRHQSNQGFTIISDSTLQSLFQMIDNKSINETDFSVYCCMKSFCYGLKISCSVSQETISEVLGLNRTTVTKSVKKLAKYNLITIQNIYFDNYQYRNEYTLNVI